eukprot:scaffold590551_cov22-Prasinocladus_malaysianus.AAC.1
MVARQEVDGVYAEDYIAMVNLRQNTALITHTSAIRNLQPDNRTGQPVLILHLKGSSIYFILSDCG